MNGTYDGRKKGLWISAGIVLLLIAAALAGWLLFTSRRIPENTSFGGLEIGGMTYGEAKKAIHAAAGEGLLSKNLKVVLPEETLILSPKEAGLKLHTARALEDACRKDKWTEERGKRSSGLLPYLSREEGYLESLFQGYARRYDTELIQSAWTLEGERPELSTDRFDPDTSCQNLVITLGFPRRQLNQKGALEAVLDVYDQALMAEQTYEVHLEIPPEAVPDAPDWERIWKECCVPAVDDSLDLTNYQQVRGSYGYQFDLEEAKKETEKAAFGDSVTVPMTYVEPEILGEGVYFRDVLGTCETRHNDNENRNTNLRLICEILDGMVVQPGEEFSYNGRVGERTKERGFLPAPAYSGNRLIQDYGGGACQCSTTLYNCALLADMEITDRVCHGAAVGYVPRGLDAAVNWGTNTDMAFRNTSHFPIKIQAKVEDGFVKMQLLGTDEKDYIIEMKSGWGEDEVAIYATSYRCKISKETGEEISRTLEARSTYYKSLG